MVIVAALAISTMVSNHIVMPLYLYALFALVERGGLVWRAWRGWWHANRKDIYAGVQEHRQDVVRAVSDAI